MKARSEMVRQAVKATLALSSEQMQSLDDRAWSAWDAAWDKARDADVKAGRRYNKEIYAELAAKARGAVFKAALAGAQS